MAHILATDYRTPKLHHLSNHITTSPISFSPSVHHHHHLKALSLPNFHPQVAQPPLAAATFVPALQMNT
jgi:hypothetical protein